MTFHHSDRLLQCSRSHRLSSAAGLVCVPEDDLEAAVDDRERRNADELRKTLTARLAAHATGANRCCVMNCGLVETTGEPVRSNEALKRPAVVFKRHHTSSKLLASQAAAFCAPSKSWPRDLCCISRGVLCAALLWAGMVSGTAALGQTQSDTAADRDMADRYDRAARAGDDVAQFYLGTLYAAGVGRTQSDTEAFEWIERAAQTRKCPGNAGGRRTDGARQGHAEGLRQQLQVGLPCRGRLASDGHEERRAPADQHARAAHDCRSDSACKDASLSVPCDGQWRHDGGAGCGPGPDLAHGSGAARTFGSVPDASRVDCRGGAAASTKVIDGAASTAAASASGATPAHSAAALRPGSDLNKENVDRLMKNVPPQYRKRFGL